jgi:hypothetical protein
VKWAILAFLFVPFVAVLLQSSTVWASDLPVGYQAVFLLRVLAYDRNLKTRTPDAASVLLVYQAGDDSSESTKNELTGELTKLAKDLRVVDLSIRVSSVAYTNPDDLDAAIGRIRPSALYLCPGLDSAVIMISTVSRRRSVLSFTGVEPWVRQGISIGLVARGAKPAVLVNLPASKAEGADLDPALLRLAEIFR